MYGLTPSAKTEKFFIALPETRLSIFKNDKPLRASKLFAFTPGTVILVPIRKNKNNENSEKYFGSYLFNLESLF